MQEQLETREQQMSYRRRNVMDQTKVEELNDGDRAYLASLEERDRVMQEMEVNESVHKNAKMPGPKDPFLWMVNVKQGSEREACFQLIRKQQALKGTRSALSI